MPQRTRPIRLRQNDGSYTTPNNQKPAEDQKDEIKSEVKPDFHPVDCPPQFPSEPE